MAEVVEILQGLKHTRLNVTDAGERRTDEVLDCRADATAAQRELGWAPTITLEAGLRRLLQ